MASEITYPLATERPHLGVREQDIETALVEKLRPVWRCSVALRILGAYTE